MLGDKLLLHAFGTIHSLRSGSGLQHSIKACRGQRPRTPSVFKYRGFSLILIHKYLILNVTAYFDLSSYLYLSRLIHDTSLIIPELSVLPDRLYHSYVRTRARVNAYRTYPLSRYSATILLNVHTRVSATYLPILYEYSHAHSPSWSTHLESYPPLYL